jgi:hypothetical protein
MIPRPAATTSHLPIGASRTFAVHVSVPSLPEPPEPIASRTAWTPSAAWRRPRAAKLARSAMPFAPLPFLSGSSSASVTRHAA